MMRSLMSSFATLIREMLRLDSADQQNDLVVVGPTSFQSSLVRRLLKWQEPPTWTVKA